MKYFALDLIGVAIPFDAVSRLYIRIIWSPQRIAFADIERPVLEYPGRGLCYDLDVRDGLGHCVRPVIYILTIVFRDRRPVSGHAVIHEAKWHDCSPLCKAQERFSFVT